MKVFPWVLDGIIICRGYETARLIFAERFPGRVNKSTLEWRGSGVGVASALFSFGFGGGRNVSMGEGLA